MKTVDDLFADPDALAALDTLASHGYAPSVVSNALDRRIAHGQRRARQTPLERARDVREAAGLERDT